MASDIVIYMRLHYVPCVFEITLLPFSVLIMLMKLS